ncbi:MAG: hypothetical protein IPH75_05720 [bacterium]|nr:hypothetical protein [bacterium]
MRVRLALALAGVAIIASSAISAPTPKEQELVNQFLKKTEKKHRPKKLGWVSANFTVNRINRFNEYNSFTNHVNSSLSGGKFSTLDNALAAGLEVGVGMNRKLSWLFGGEYWLKTGDQLSGSITYAPPSGGGPVELTDPQSEIKVYGAYTGVSYSIWNPRSAGDVLNGGSAWITGNVGYYQVNWDLFPQYENLNLSTATPDGANTTFKGNAPGFSIGGGVDYPVGFGGLTFAAEANYLHLNFSNVAWYNSADQEVVATYNESPDSRVDLKMSGVRARFALKKYFGW